MFNFAIEPTIKIRNKTDRCSYRSVSSEHSEVQFSGFSFEAQHQNPHYTTNEGFSRRILATCSVDLPVHRSSFCVLIGSESKPTTTRTEAARPCTDDLWLIYSLHTAQISSHISVIRSSLD